jgi:hypothetical protein
MILKISFALLMTFAGISLYPMPIAQTPLQLLGLMLVCTAIQTFGDITRELINK